MGVCTALTERSLEKFLENLLHGGHVTQDRNAHRHLTVDGCGYHRGLAESIWENLCLGLKAKPALGDTLPVYVEREEPKPQPSLRPQRTHQQYVNRPYRM